MILIKNSGTKIQKYCELLGQGYSIKIIDYESVIYRKINDVYDVEISGLDNACKRFHANIYIWKNTVTIEEKYSDITSFEKLQDALVTILFKYSSLNS